MVEVGITIPDPEEELLGDRSFPHCNLIFVGLNTAIDWMTLFGIYFPGLICDCLTKN